MSALLITGNSGEHITVTEDQIRSIAQGMALHDSRSQGDKRQYFIREEIGPNHYRTALFAVDAGTPEDTFLRTLPND